MPPRPSNPAGRPGRHRTVQSVPGTPSTPQRRKPTSTSSFGVSGRENHDASAFYRRFSSPVIDNDDQLGTQRDLDQIFCHDARSMKEVKNGTVALVVTSPPYFAGKEYEESLGEDGVPATYLEYLDLLRAVFTECVQKLEPGGRIAVNVANLGRRPYRSLSADVIGILQDDLRLLLRGEIIWMKQRGSSGSCAWGSFQRPGNPVLRDLTERVIVASKGRFDRAIPAKVRYSRHLPSVSTMTRDDFMENTLDVWELPAESATRVGHPAPFPVELPQRLIELYTYRGDLVLDPFIGSGSTAVAAVRTERHFVGYDTDEGYMAQAKDRIEREREHRESNTGCSALQVALPAVTVKAGEEEPFFQQATREGWASRDIAREALRQCGFSGIREKVRIGAGIDISFLATDTRKRTWSFEVCGPFASYRPGLKRTDVLWRALGRAAALHELQPDLPLVLLTPDVPPPNSPGGAALAAVTGPGKPVHSVIVFTSPDDLERLRNLSRGKAR